jgi:phosphohistidine phosphatase
MDLYLIRHADAAPAEPDGNDVVRPLTKLGHMQAKALAAALVKRGVSFSVVVTSPLIRAAQTTEHLMAALPEPHPPLHVFDEIGYEVRPKKIVAFLNSLPGNSIAIVGHQPGLSRFAGWLIGDKSVGLTLEKAGFAKLECSDWEKDEGTLVELVTPDWYG